MAKKPLTARVTELEAQVESLLGMISFLQTQLSIERQGHNPPLERTGAPYVHWQVDPRQLGIHPDKLNPPWRIQCSSHGEPQVEQDPRRKSVEESQQELERRHPDSYRRRGLM